MTTVRERRRIDGPLREAVCNIWPRFRGRMVFMYALGLDRGWIKVGMTASPRVRFGIHWNAVDGAVKWAHLFRPVPRTVARIAEQAAHRSLRESGGKVVLGKETFDGIEPGHAILACRKAIDMAARKVQWS